MQRNEIDNKIARAWCGPVLQSANPAEFVKQLRFQFECAGLCIIPAVADDAEIERVRKALIEMHACGKSVAGCDMARAAAAAVREHKGEPDAPKG